MANIFVTPRNQLITGLLLSTLLKLSGDNLIVALFFKKWQEYLEAIKLEPGSATVLLQIENEDDLNVAVKITKLYCRTDKRLSTSGLKTLLGIYNSPVFINAVALYPKDKIIKGLLTLI